ncbi:MAG: hypothetical protein KAH48_02245 [Chlorobi bacterium]|nr:hypothetical protein [Chlorobiota bacterium]
MEKLKDIKTIAAELGLSKRKVLDLMKSGMLWYKRIGRKYFSTETKIELFIYGDQSELVPVVACYKKHAGNLGPVVIPDNVGR